MQSKEAGEKFLFQLRSAVMMHKQNIARPEVLSAIAKKFSEEYPDLFNYYQFLEDISGKESLQLFRNDLQKARYNRITVFLQ